MKPIRLLFLFLPLISFMPGIARGQNIRTLNADSAISEEISPFMGDQVERLAETAGSEEEFSAMAEELQERNAKSVDLNRAGKQNLEAIPFLTPAQRSNLLDYLVTYGEVLSIYELASVPGFDSSLIRRIEPFFNITPASRIPHATPRNLLRLGRHELLIRAGQSFPLPSGYKATDSAGVVRAYPGSPQRFYFKYTWSYFDRIKIGIAGEKDPGEQFFRGAQKQGMDFYSYYLSLGNIGILKSLVIGNFRASFGQGLTMASGYSPGSAPGFLNLIPRTGGVRPAPGMSESSYLRGAAATIKVKGLEISAFFSRHSRDATVNSTDSLSGTTGEISSIGLSGYHRTGQEIAKRNAVQELLAGGNISFIMAPRQSWGFRAGITGIWNKYSAPYVPDSHPYNRFGFRGQENMNIGIDGQVRFRGIWLFGEAARSRNGGLVALAGISLSPAPGVSLCAIWREYGRDYQNSYSNAFRQGSACANEKGIYAAITASLHPRLTVSGYADLFSFPWLRYRTDLPTRGAELGVLADIKAPGNVSFNLRFYQKTTRINETTQPGTIVHKLADQVIRDYRLNAEWIPNPGITLRTRIEIRESGSASGKRSLGYLVYQDGQVKTFRWPEMMVLRISLFDVPDYDSRIYVYEPEVLYGYSVPAYEGRGVRSVLLLKFAIGRAVDLWLRGGVTWYADRNEVGTGADLTKGNFRVDLSGQLMVRL